MAVRIELADIQDMVSKATGGIVPPSDPSGPPVHPAPGPGPVPVPAVPTVPVQVTKTTDKPVGWKEKIKGSYKAITAFVGAVLTLVSQLHAITPFLPDQWRTWIGAAVAILTAISTFLVRNEQWVDSL